jgi:hypothetical protein
MKVFNHIRTFEINLVRDHYTRYGLHLNTKGKDYLAKLLRLLKIFLIVVRLLQ